MAEPSARVAVIGGSGFYDLAGLTDVIPWKPETPFGAPSDTLRIGTLHGHRVAFLPRHGVGHRILPQDLPQRANLWALKTLGVEGVIAVSAVGSLNAAIEPGHLVAPDQIIDCTRGLRPSTFFSNGLVAHVGFADPFCADLSARLVAAGRALGQTVHGGGTYVCMEGPAFSTRAESRLYRSWGASVIGMTAIPEAKLAREAEIAYAMLAIATDYDVWHESAEDVSAALVVARLHESVATARQIVSNVIRDLPRDWTSTAAGALATAIQSDPVLIPDSMKRDLAPIIGKYVR